jgi:hypothetical protein
MCWLVPLVVYNEFINFLRVQASRSLLLLVPFSLIIVLLSS